MLCRVQEELAAVSDLAPVQRVPQRIRLSLAYSTHPPLPSSTPSRWRVVLPAPGRLCLFRATPIDGGERHFSRRCLPSMTLLGIELDAKYHAIATERLAMQLTRAA